MGDINQSIAELKAGRKLDDNPVILSSLGLAYLGAGSPGETKKALGELRQLSTERYVSPFCFALIYAGLGDKNQTFAWLEKTYENRSLELAGMRTIPAFKSLESDPRFADLIRRIGLPQ